MRATDEFAKECPIFFDHYTNRGREPIKYGLECGSGWHQIIFEMAKEIEALSHSTGKKYKAVQIKEKFGGLRVYVNQNDAEIDEIIKRAESLCAKTCEACGKAGKNIAKGGWYKTVCEEHE